MRRLLSILVTVAVLGGAVTAFALTGSGPATFTVTAEVEQAPNLFVGNRVMVRGVEVGKITDVTPRPAGVTITMEIRESAKIPADATLSVVPITVISDRYVQFFPAYKGGPTLRDGAHLAVDRTQIPAELDDVLTQLQGLLGALEPKPGQRRGPLARLVSDLDDALDGRSEDLSTALSSSASVLENLADSQTDITRVIQNLDRLFISLADRSSEFGILNQRLRLVTGSLLADQEDLEGTIENLAFFSTQTASLISESGDDLGESFGRLSGVVRRLLKHQGALLRTVRWTNVIAQGVGATDAAGKGLYAYSGRQAPPGTAGAEYNYRIDTRDTIACERIDALIQSFIKLNPSATITQLRDTLMSFFPETYKDDLAFLVDQLIPLCADLPGLQPTSRSGAAIDRLARDIGRNRMRALIAAWQRGRSLP